MAKSYSVTLEVHNPRRGVAPSKVIMKRIHRTVKASNRNEAWDKAAKLGSDYNRTHKRKCVIGAIRS